MILHQHLQGSFHYNDFQKHHQNTHQDFNKWCSHKWIQDRKGNPFILLMEFFASNKRSDPKIEGFNDGEEFKLKSYVGDIVFTIPNP